MPIMIYMNKTNFSQGIKSTNWKVHSIGALIKIGDVLFPNKHAWAAVVREIAFVMLDIFQFYL